MFEFALVPLVVVVVAVVAWLMLSGRSERDPSSSVNAFHRALTAMQPGDEEEEGRGGRSRRRERGDATSTPAAETDQAEPGPEGTTDEAEPDAAETTDEAGDRQGPGGSA